MYNSDQNYKGMDVIELRQYAIAETNSRLVKADLLTLKTTRQREV